MQMTDSDPLARARPAHGAIAATTAAPKLRQYLPAKEACHGH